MSTTHTIFLAGAGGAVGRRLTPLLVAAGHRVFGMTRSTARADLIKTGGAMPMVLDVFDRDALTRAVAEARPTIVIHQLTDLPFGLPPNMMAAAAAGNARIRDEGTRNLVAAAIEAGAERLVAQSIAWIYAPGRAPYVEDDPLDLRADGPRGISVKGVAAMERSVMNSPPLAGAILRYGRFYGPGTGVEKLPERPTVHVDAAAFAAVLAVQTTAVGIFNIADPDGPVSIDKARRELGFDPGFRIASEHDGTGAMSNEAIAASSIAAPIRP